MIERQWLGVGVAVCVCLYVEGAEVKVCEDLSQKAIIVIES